MTDKQIYLSIAVISAVTILLRFAPFLVFSKRKTPEIITRFGRTLPYAVMGMLCVYCLKDVSFGEAGGYLPALIASALVVGSYLWKKNTLLSIILGTAAYMFLVQSVFPG